MVISYTIIFQHLSPPEKQQANSYINSKRIFIYSKIGMELEIFIKCKLANQLPVHDKDT